MQLSLLSVLTDPCSHKVSCKPQAAEDAVCTGNLSPLFQSACANTYKAATVFFSREDGEAWFSEEAALQPRFVF